MERICIIGCSGTGKTTLADNLGKELNLPVYHIDGIHHLENWKIRDKKERDEIILNKVKKTKWIIDGTYKKTLEERIKNADLVIFTAAHKKFDYDMISKNAKAIFDTRNAMKDIKNRDNVELL